MGRPIKNSEILKRQQRREKKYPWPVRVMLWVTATVLVLLTANEIVSLYQDVSKLKQEEQHLELEAEALREESEELERQLSTGLTKEEIIDYAHSVLSLVFENEILLVPTD